MYYLTKKINSILIKFSEMKNLVLKEMCSNIFKLGNLFNQAETITNNISSSEQCSWIKDHIVDANPLYFLGIENKYYESN